MRCPSCQNQNPDGVKFCGECGLAFGARCAACGAPNPSSNKFCFECGGALGVAPEQPREPDLPSDERRHVTVLFSDVVGYTAMGENLDPEVVESVVGRIKQESVTIVARHGGMVNQFAGDEVLALFGILQAQEDDPVRAVRAAIELHRMVRELRSTLQQDLPQPLAMHTGIATGLVVTNQRDNRDGRFGIVGAAVNIGARLKAAAQPDDILVSPATRRMIAPFFETEALAEVAIKGKREPMVPHRVLRESETRSRFEAATQRGLSSYQTRASELAELRVHWDDACAGKGHLVLIAGEAGAGKSRILYELCAPLAADAVTVLQGNCRGQSRGTSYLPFVEALRGLLEITDEIPPQRLVSHIEARLSALDGALLPQMPQILHLLSLRSEAHRLPEQLAGDALVEAAAESLAAVLLAQAERRPVLLLLEDWHFADATSTATLRTLAARAEGARLLIVVTHRLEDTGDWPAEIRHRRIDLRAFDLDGTRELLCDLLDTAEVPGSLLAVIHERTGGNPFFIEELTRALLERGALVIEDGTAHLSAPWTELGLPNSVQAIIRSRFDHLPPPARRLVRLASVIGARSSYRILVHLYEKPAELPEALSALLDAQILDEVSGRAVAERRAQARTNSDREYVFRHALTRDVIYESLRIEPRKQLHGRVARAIEELYASRLDEQVHTLYHHFGRAESWREAVDYGRRAADRAVTLSQLDEARAILDQVLEWIPHLRGADGHEVAIDVLLRQEQVLESLGRREAQENVIARMYALMDVSGDDGRLADVATRQGDLHTSMGRYEAAENVLKQALARCEARGDQEAQARALRSLGFLRWNQGRLSDAVAFNQAALAIDEELGATSAQASDLANMGAVLRNAGDYERALACLERASELYEETAQPTRHALTRYSIANIARDRGDLEGAAREYRRACQRFTENRDHNMAARALAGMAGVHWERNEIEDSLLLYREAVDVSCNAGLGDAHAHALRILGERLCQVERHAEAVPYLLESAQILAKLGDRKGASALWESLAGMYEQHLDQPERALEAWERVRELFEQDGDARGALAALDELARLARERLGDPQRALDYLERAAALAGEVDDAAKRGELANAMGILAWRLGKFEMALAHYEHARANYRARGLRAHEGFILNSIGVTLAKIGRTDEALAVLHEALPLHRDYQQPLFEGHALAAMGDIQRDSGDYEQAERSYSASLALRTTIADQRGEGWMHHALAQVALAQGNRDSARLRLDAARAVADALSDDELRQAIAACERELLPSAQPAEAAAAGEDGRARRPDSISDA